MLTLQELKAMEPHQVIATDSPSGINLSGSGNMLRQVAVRGEIHDWTVYAHLATNDVAYVRRCGDKVLMEAEIKKLVPCTIEAFRMYRY